MNKFLYIILIFLFSLTVMSCFDKSELESWEKSGEKSGAEKGLWTKQFGTSSDDYANGVATDSSGNVYVTGMTNWLDADLASSLSGFEEGIGEIFVVKYDSSGTKHWMKQLGTTHTFYGMPRLTLDKGTGVATDSSGNVYVTGFTDGGLDGNTNASGTGEFFNDSFVVKYNSSGTKQWTKQFGAKSVDRAHGIATDSSGNVYVTGETEGGLDGNTNAGGYDSFVVKYNSDGVLQ